MKKAAAILATTALAGGAVWFVLDYRHDRRCQAYQDDYLNSVSRMRDAGTAMDGLARLKVQSKGLEEIFRRNADVLAPLLITIGEECGPLAASTTERKASELLR